MANGKGINDERAKAYEQLLKDELKLEKQKSKEVQKYELELRKEVESKIKKVREQVEEDFQAKLIALELKGIKVTQKQKEDLLKQSKLREEREAKKQKKEAERELRQAKIDSLRSGTTIDGKEKSLMQKTGDNIKAGLLGLGDTFSNTLKKELDDLKKAFGNTVNKAMSTYAQYQTGINARLQASGKSMSSLEKNLSKVAYSPLLKSEDLYNNLSKLVADGIVSNVEQRAFLMTIKDNIATTFDANNASMRRIIRLQQEDSTASRLGMEAFLTRYMNQMVQNTEYLTSSFDNVQSALLEASSLMSMSGANEFEYQVQKWLGAMSGVGLSESTSSSLAQALGYLGSGNIEQLGSSSLQNLLVMASSRAGLSYSDMLRGGLGGNTTNALLASIVNFVQEIWDNSKDNNVVLSQLSNTFGLTVSDVRSIANMSEDLKNSLLGTNMTTSQMYGELGYQFDQMGSRMSIATLMENAFNNFAFQTGATMASNPATYALWKIADMIQSTTGGIDVPLATALGTGIVNMPTIDQMLKLGLIGMSTLQNIGGIASAVSSLGSGASLLKAMGISEDTSIIARGASLSQAQSGFTTSQSAYMINQNQSAFADSANMMREQQEKETMQNLNQPEIDIKTIHEDILDMMVILRDTGVRIQDSSITGLTDALSGRG